MNFSLKSVKYSIVLLFFFNNSLASTALVEEIEEEISRKSGIELVLISPNSNLECNKCEYSNLIINEHKKTYALNLINGKNKTEVSGIYYEAFKMPIVSSKINKGELISDEKITYKKIRANKKYDDYFTNKSEIVGFRAKKNLTPGLPVNKRDIAQGEIIKRNSEVKIIYSKGAISLESIGKVVSESEIGSEVKVKNLESGKILTGIALDSKTVRIGE